MFRLAFRFLVATSCAVAISQEQVKPAQRTEPRITLKSFCEGVFNANEEDYLQMIILSGKRQKEIQKQYPNDHLSISEMIRDGSVVGDPAVLVTSYKIKKIEVSGDTATGEVDYEVVGEFKQGSMNRIATEFYSAKQRTIHEVIKLRYGSGTNSMGARGIAWYVEDPPVPKVSVIAMTRRCRKELETFQGIANNAKKRGEQIPSNITWGISTFEKKLQALQSIQL